MVHLTRFDRRHALMIFRSAASPKTIARLGRLFCSVSDGHSSDLISEVFSSHLVSCSVTVGSALVWLDGRREGGAAALLGLLPRRVGVRFQLSGEPHLVFKALSKLHRLLSYVDVCDDGGIDGAVFLGV